jgi:uncharacterized membrane protein YebE (DUF533 family)
MDAQDLIHNVLKGALTGRHKRGGRAWRAMSGGGSRSFLNASTLLTLGGLAWGVYEAATAKPGGFAGGAAQPGAVPPPLPRPSLPGAPAGGAVPEGTLRLLRLMISAARADGTLHETERQAILEHARAAGAEALIKAELDSTRPLREILAGIDDSNQRRDLYVLAFTIVRADEGVTGGERIYLAQLAHQLGLSAEETKALEAEQAARIDVENEGAEG